MGAVNANQEGHFKVCMNNSRSEYKPRLRQRYTVNMQKQIIEALTMRQKLNSTITANTVTNLQTIETNVLAFRCLIYL